MKRDEAIKSLELLEVNFTGQIPVVAAVPIQCIDEAVKSETGVPASICLSATKDLVHQIFDDIEHQICQNCKHHKQDGWCSELELKTSDDFGCNLWLEVEQ